jgi:4-aminobutyrate aminotransferase-like enzyme
VQKAAETGAYLGEKLETLHKYQIVGDVRGMGMLQAVELLQEREGYKPLEPSRSARTEAGYAIGVMNWA